MGGVPLGKFACLADAHASAHKIDTSWLYGHEETRVGLLAQVCHSRSGISYQCNRAFHAEGQGRQGGKDVAAHEPPRLSRSYFLEWLDLCHTRDK